MARRLSNASLPRLYTFFLLQQRLRAVSCLPKSTTSSERPRHGTLHTIAVLATLYHIHARSVALFLRDCPSAPILVLRIGSPAALA